MWLLLNVQNGLFIKMMFQLNTHKFRKWEVEVMYKIIREHSSDSLSWTPHQTKNLQCHLVSAVGHLLDVPLVIPSKVVPHNSADYSCARSCPPEYQCKPFPSCYLHFAHVEAHHHCFCQRGYLSLPVLEKQLGPHSERFLVLLLKKLLTFLLIFWQGIPGWSEKRASPELAQSFWRHHYPS